MLLLVRHLLLLPLRRIPLPRRCKQQLQRHTRLYRLQFSRRQLLLPAAAGSKLIIAAATEAVPAVCLPGLLVRQ